MEGRKAEVRRRKVKRQGGHFGEFCSGRKKGGMRKEKRRNAESEKERNHSGVLKSSSRCKPQAALKNAEGRSQK